jgi:O-acetyl-ADP-ribose deacetylase (regulator of RNase III)
MRIEPQLGDITRQHDVDVIVNAANEALARGGGVCGAIFAAAGPELDAACAALGGCRTGDAVATPGFRLGVPWIVHAVGPVWHGGAHHEARLLASAYRRAVEAARDLGARSVAFPAISTGIYGYPREEAAGIAVATLRQCAGELDLVRLVAFDPETLEAYERHLARP